MDVKDVETYFTDILIREEDVSAGVAAVRTLMEVLRQDKSETIQGLHETFKTAIHVMVNTDYPVTAIKSACELFQRFITLATLDSSSYDECREIMTNRGKLFLQKLNQARNRIADLAVPFFIKGSKVLVHSRSRVVLQTLVQAAQAGKKFQVYVTQSAPDNIGEKMNRELQEAGIQSTLILDSAIGYIMDKIDFVLVGAEGVCETGGIINKIGSFMIAFVAKNMNKRVYVLSESFKFCRIDPLDNNDIPLECRFTKSMREGDLTSQHPLVDYTPPLFIDLLFTDLGILTTPAVCDELINLYT